MHKFISFVVAGIITGFTFCENFTAPSSRYLAEISTSLHQELIPNIHTQTQKLQSQEITAIGDSVMLGASSKIQELMPNCIIDAKVARQAWSALDIAKELNRQENLKDTVIIALGTNGTFQSEVGQELLDYLGTDREIYWVTAYGKTLSWQEEVNTVIYELAEQNDNLHVIDWASEASQHSDWFYEDGIHLKLDGQSGYASLLFEAIQN